VILPRHRTYIDPALTWFALWCRANQERKAEAALAGAGIATYRPLETRQINKRGKILQIERPPVGRYLFAGLDEAQAQAQSLRDVRDALHQPSDPPLGRLIRTEAGPVQVPAELLQPFADAIARLGEPVQARCLFSKGMDALVVKGPLAGLLAAIQTASDDRVRALVKMFGGRTLVEFEPEQLERVA
jgi:transcription antitermination factor NusG